MAGGVRYCSCGSGLVKPPFSHIQFLLFLHRLAKMKEGGKATLVIPPELAYGDAGSGGAVPPGATLKFEVELFKVNP